jgi:uncharacterized integral membrane protein
MRWLLFWLISAPLLAIAASFAITNRQTVTLGLWPFDEQVVVPQYVVVFVALVIGFLWGALLGLVSAALSRPRLRKGRGRGPVPPAGKPSLADGGN